jgi:hypothetical protein
MYTVGIAIDVKSARGAKNISGTDLVFIFYWAGSRLLPGGDSRNRNGLKPKTPKSFISTPMRENVKKQKKMVKEAMFDGNTNPSHDEQRRRNGQILICASPYETISTDKIFVRLLILTRPDPMLAA